MLDLSERVAGRIQLTTDGLTAYPNAVGLAFRHKIDFAQLVKHYASPRARGRPVTAPLSAPAPTSASIGQPRPGADLDQLRRASEPHDAHGQCAGSHG